MQPEMTDTEVVAHLRQYVTETHSHWSWPTDACGYKQHMRFVKYRNDNLLRLGRGQTSVTDLALEYASKLESGDIPEYKES